MKALGSSDFGFPAVLPERVIPEGERRGNKAIQKHNAVPQARHGTGASSPRKPGTTALMIGSEEENLV